MPANKGMDCISLGMERCVIVVWPQWVKIPARRQPFKASLPNRTIVTWYSYCEPPHTIVGESFVIVFLCC